MASSFVGAGVRVWIEASRRPRVPVHLGQRLLSARPQILNIDGQAQEHIMNSMTWSPARNPVPLPLPLIGRLVPAGGRYTPLETRAARRLPLPDCCKPR